MGELGRILALDVGDRRIGVAVSDPLRVISSPVVTLERSRSGDDARNVARLVAEWKAGLVVVGLPLLPSGDKGEQAQRVLDFLRHLERAVAVPIVTWDESFTTVEAEARLRERGRSAAESATGIDAEAAAVILEEWLRENGPGSSGAAPPGHREGEA
jgi:putative Holliday junction resolvase